MAKNKGGREVRKPKQVKKPTADSPVVLAVKSEKSPKHGK